MPPAPMAGPEPAAMVDVTLWGSLKSAAGGSAQVSVEAANVRQLLKRLAEAHPGLAPVIEKGVTVSIDGTLHQDDWFAEIGPDSEVYVLPRMEGG